MLGEARRSRLRYLTLLRRVTPYNARARYRRAGAVLMVLVVAAISDHRLVALPCLLPAVVALIMDFLCIHFDVLGTLPTNRFALYVVENNEATSGVPRLNTISLCYLVGMLGVLTVPTWVATDLPGWLRLAGLAGGVILVCSIAASIFIEHTWYAPNAHPPWWHEPARMFGGPLGVVVSGAIAVPSQLVHPMGPPGSWSAVVVLVLIPMATMVRIHDTDELVGVIDELVREEAHEGRELVLREVHGNLSTQLRLLSQQAYALREEQPALHMLAVSANSRLREIMSLADPERTTSGTPDTLLVAARTLAMAVGAQVTGRVEVGTLSADDRDLTRVVLNDLVGNGINAGAEQLQVEVIRRDEVLEVSVTDDGRPMPVGVWKTAGTSSGRLAQYLAGLSGALEMTASSATDDHPRKTVVARWRARAEGIDGEETATT